jgi:hypothetical protein
MNVRGEGGTGEIRSEPIARAPADIDGEHLRSIVEANARAYQSAFAGSASDGAGFIRWQQALPTFADEVELDGGRVQSGSGE